MAKYNIESPLVRYPDEKMVRVVNPIVVINFFSLCFSYMGKKRKTSGGDSPNYWVFSIGIFISMLIGGLTYYLSRVWWITLAVLFFILSLVIYLSYELRGQSYCWRDSAGDGISACKSGITGIPIPNMFCGSKDACSCDPSQPCSNPKDTCVNGRCVPPIAPPSSVVWNLTS